MTGYCTQGRHDECPGHGTVIESSFFRDGLDLSTVACNCSCHDAWREAERDRVMADVSD